MYNDVCISYLLYMYIIIYCIYIGIPFDLPMF